MNARGSTEVIIATIGLSMGVLSQNLFTMIVTMAVVTTMAMPPMLRAALARLPLGEEEKARLEREEFEENGFVANLERLLLAVDESANGKFASRLAGLLAGGRGTPITVLACRRPRQAAGRKARGGREPRDRRSSNAAKAVADAEKRSAHASRSDDAGRADKVADAVADEAEKGFDLLVVGMDKVLGAEDGFDRKIEDLAAPSRDPLRSSPPRACTSSTGNARVQDPGPGLRQRRVAARRRDRRRAGAAEPRSGHVVYVSTTRDRGARRNGASISLAREEAILKERLRPRRATMSSATTVARRRGP